MGIVKKVVIAGVVITLATGSIAWISGAIDAGTFVADKVVQSGIIDDAKEYIEEQISEIYVSEDGTTIEIPVEKISEFADLILTYADKSGLTALAADYGIDIEAIADGDLSSIQDYVENNTFEVEISEFKSWLSSLFD